MVQIIRSAIAHSKLRSTIGLVVVMGDSETKKISVGYAKQWKRKNITPIPVEIKKIHDEIDWDKIVIDQSAGQSFIELLQNKNNLRVDVITTQKNLKDPRELENMVVMDKIEVTEFFMTLKQSHCIVFPEDKDTSVQQIVDQIPLFTEHITESGSADYYASGKEPDNLIKALLLCCFSLRKLLQNVSLIHVVGRAFLSGIPSQSNQPFNMDTILADMGGEISW